MKKPLNAAPMGSLVVEQIARKGDLISDRLPLVHYLHLRQPPIVERKGTEAAMLPSSGSDGCSFYPTTITQGGKDFDPQLIGEERNTKTVIKWPMTLNRSQGRAAIGGGKSLNFFSVVVMFQAGNEGWAEWEEERLGKSEAEWELGRTSLSLSPPYTIS
ncbi:unnamed protein product [Lactuca virosa]|uniref:Uncharacterized protein n=1 Tax=Lactuca virosa TaxID=75947 RepID=A0AAU9MBH4_9ASTR|nr:unnamed protein product [Lactuca virosa]